MERQRELPELPDRWSSIARIGSPTLNAFTPARVTRAPSFMCSTSIALVLDKLAEMIDRRQRVTVRARFEVS
jgi:hypothetical protein